MNELKGLMKRDCFLIKNRVYRIIAVIIVILAVNATYCYLGLKAEATEMATGMRLEDFQLSMEYIPYGWIMIQLSGIFVAFDFVRNDLFRYCSNILVKLSRRPSYLFSKLLVGTAMCFMIAAIIFFGIYGIWSFFDIAEGMEQEWKTVLLKSAVCHFTGMAVIFCVYCVLSLAFSEIVCFILCLVAVCAGLKSKLGLFFCNQVMLYRHRPYDLEVMTSTGGTFLYIVTIIAVLIAVGAFLISRVDVFGAKED